MLLHLDADAFFAAVEQAADARLRGRPVAVGGALRGVVASASYEARRFGIVSAMPMARARQLCPRLVVVPPDFERYELFSRRVFAYARDFTPLVEVGSIDEGYLDLSGCGRHPAEVGRIIQRACLQSLRISISEGIGKNKLVSQIASKLRKPAGFVEVPAGGETGFLHPLASSWLPGVGVRLGEVFRTAGLATIGHVAATPPGLLGLLAGAAAGRLHAFAHGRDDRPVIPDPPEAKSYGTQETFLQDVTDRTFLTARLRVMADALMARVRGDRKAVRTVVLRLRYQDMAEVRRSESLAEPADLEHLVYPLLPVLLDRAWERRVGVRLLGLKFQQVYKGALVMELPLEGITVADERRHKLASTVDALRRAGVSVMRGHDLWLKGRDGQPRAELEAGEAGPTEERAEEEAPDRALRERPRGGPEGGRTVHRESAPLAALNVRSVYSFMDSLLTIPGLVEAAAERGVQSVALMDPNLHGAVPFFQAARAAGLHPVIGAELSCGGRRVLAYVENRAGYENLCRLLSLRNGAEVARAELEERRGGLILKLPEGPAALPEIRYARPEDRTRFQIVQSIRTLTLLREPHPEKRRGDFHFPDAGEMRRRFDREALRRSAELAERCRFGFEFGVLRFPRYVPEDGGAPAQMLRRLAEEGLSRRYGERAPRHRGQLLEELAIISEVGYEDYFLVVHDLLEECRRRGIQWITRGSAADSLVCYCLGISGVCPVRFELYFKRFLNRERMALQKLPDIDIDSAHDRKDEVVRLILQRHGPEHAAIVGGFSTFQARSAVAEIAKVLGMPDREIRRLTSRLPHTDADCLAEAIRGNHLHLDFPIDEEPCRTALSMAAFLDGIPRYPKMHPCGVVLSRDPVRSLCPVFTSAKGWPATHFDMEAVEAVGLVKMDVLAQGGLAVLRDAAAMLAERGIAVDPESLEPWEDEGVWDMIAAGQSRGVHHIESPAMCSLARVAGVRDIDRLIAVVSVIRPGAACGSKKREFCRRAQGLEAVQYAHPSLEPVLRSTFGLIAYEEHVLQICEAFAGLGAGRADVLRRALVKADRRVIEKIEGEFREAARGLGRAEGEIQTVWELVAGFQGYAFCRAHSTAYGVEAFQGAWMKRHHPAEFMAAVLTHGKGFYSRLVYTLECRLLGIGFLLPCVNASGAGYRVERGKDGAPSIRVPLEAAKSLTEGLLERHGRERRRGSFASLADFVRRTAPHPEEMLALIRAGAFDGFGESRPAQFWRARSLGLWPRGEDWLFPAETEVKGLLEAMEGPDRMARLREETELFGFTVSGHPLELHPETAWGTYCPISRLGDFPGQTVMVCGLIIQDRVHRQGTGELMKFITLCDWTGFIECEIFAAAYRRWGLATVRWPVVEAEAVVRLFENGKGLALEVRRVGQCRQRTHPTKSPVEPAG
ncbi:MAG: polymerase [Verrucomicrobiales bacterium]|nr:polymerase [Verrucomicrobiales bacterium]